MTVWNCDARVTRFTVAVPAPFGLGSGQFVLQTVAGLYVVCGIGGLAVAGSLVGLQVVFPRDELEDLRNAFGGADKVPGSPPQNSAVEMLGRRSPGPLSQRSGGSGRPPMRGGPRQAQSDSDGSEATSAFVDGRIVTPRMLIKTPAEGSPAPKAPGQAGGTARVSLFVTPADID